MTKDTGNIEFATIHETKCQVSYKSVYMQKCEIFQQFLLIISQFAYSKEKEKWWRVRDILSFELILVD